MALKQIRTLMKAQRYDRALAKVEGILADHRGCSHLWNLRGDLIQLLETQDGPPLTEAAKSYKTALRLNPDNLETLQSLAHFYDAVEPRPSIAKRYAEAYIAKAKRGIAEMERVIAGEP